MKHKKLIFAVIIIVIASCFSFAGKDGAKQAVPRRKWTASEDEQLLAAIKEVKKEIAGAINWQRVAGKLRIGRTGSRCRERYFCYLERQLDVYFSEEDDLRLIQLYNEMGPRWMEIASFFPNKNYIIVKNRLMKIKNLGMYKDMYLQIPINQSENVIVNDKIDSNQFEQFFPPTDKPQQEDDIFEDANSHVDVDDWF